MKLNSNNTVIYPKILNNIYDNNNISYKFIFNIPLFKIYDYNISILIFLLLILSFIIELYKNCYILFILVTYLIIDFHKFYFLLIISFNLIGYFL